MLKVICFQGVNWNTSNPRMYISIYKLPKYKDLEIEIENLWRLKTTTIPIVVGALGLIKKGTIDCRKKISGEPSLSEIQKIVLNSAAHILRRALSI